MAERKYIDKDRPEDALLTYQPTHAQLREIIQTSVSPEIFSALSTRIVSPEISIMRVPHGVDRNRWLNNAIWMNQHGSPIDTSRYHHEIPHPPRIVATPCHGGKLHDNNHAFKIYLIVNNWVVGDETDFPQWTGENMSLTAFYPDGDWMDVKLQIGEVHYQLRREAYSHGICNECFDKIRSDRRIK